VGERPRGPQHDVPAGSQRRQPHRQLPRPALDAAELRPDGGAGVDREAGPVDHAAMIAAVIATGGTVLFHESMHLRSDAV